MILIGQYDSSFVRRVAIAMSLYGMEFEHRPWSVFGDADKIREFNPLTRVPTLVLDDGTVLTDCMTILSWLDRQVTPEKSLTPPTEPASTHCLSVMAIAGGMADKAVALFYEQRVHEHCSDMWVARCKSQITDAARWLEADRKLRTRTYWFGEKISHADIAVSAALAHTQASHPHLFGNEEIQTLLDHSTQTETLPVFQKVFQNFIPPT